MMAIENDKAITPNKSLNLTGAAFSFRAAWSNCSGPGKFARRGDAKTMLSIKPNRLVVVAIQVRSHGSPHCQK